MSFKENLNLLCRKQGTTLTTMLKDLGYSTSKTTAINRGQIPKEETMLEMAKYLHCSVMDFFADEEDIEEAVEPENEDESDILRIYRALPRRAKHEFMAMAYEFENRKEYEGDNANAVG